MEWGFTMKRIWLFLFLSIFVPSVGSAATVNLDIRLDFDAIKTIHDCYSVYGTNVPAPGTTFPTPGNCGINQNINFGETLSSYLTVQGVWDTVTGYVQPFSSSCYFGSEKCVLAAYLRVDFSSLSSLQIRFWNNIVTTFNFNLLTGTGQNLWQDDNAPYWSTGVFDLTNVRAVISTQVVPLPASLMLLSFGLLAFVTLGCWGKRRYKQFFADSSIERELHWCVLRSDKATFRGLL